MISVENCSGAGPIKVANCTVFLEHGLSVWCLPTSVSALKSLGTPSNSRIFVALTRISRSDPCKCAIIAYGLLILRGEAASVEVGCLDC